MISKACYVAEYRKKLEAMARWPEVELTLILPPYWGSGTRKLMLEPDNAHGYQMLVESPRLNGHFHLHYYPRLAEHLRRLRPDLVHIDEEPYDFVAYHALRAAQRARAKVLFFTWQNLERHYPFPFSWLEAQVLRLADGAIAGGQEAAAILRRKGFAGPLFVIPQFGVDPDAFAFRQAEPPATPFVIGYVGRLVEEKGLLLLVQALAGLGGHWSLRVLGEGPMQQPMQTQAQRLDIASRIEFRGTVPSSAVPGFYHGLHALVLPSLTTWRWKEQFGRVLIEAMACGVPVVGSSSGEIPQVIGDAGLVFPEGDGEALRQKLRLLMENSTLRRELARRGRERVLEHYTHERVAEDTLRAYRQVLTGFD